MPEQCDRLIGGSRLIRSRLRVLFQAILTALYWDTALYRDAALLGDPCSIVARVPRQENKDPVLDGGCDLRPPITNSHKLPTVANSVLCEFPATTTLLIHTCIYMIFFKVALFGNNFIFVNGWASLVEPPKPLRVLIPSHSSPETGFQL